jgi:Rv0078B-related antitoxin
MDLSPGSPEAERFRVTLDLFDLGVQMYRQRMRREHPQYNEEAIEAEVQAWLFRRPGAEFGDYPGRPSSRFS